MAFSTVSIAVNQLRDAGLIVETVVTNGSQGTRPGRRPTVLRVAHRPVRGLGIDIGHNYVRIMIGTSPRAIIDERAADMPTGLAPGRALAYVTRLAKEMVADNGLSLADIDACGVGVPSPLDATTGQIRSNNILPAWADTSPAEVLGESLGVKVVTENDANLGALAESAIGQWAGSKYLVFVKVGSGIGLGLYLDGQICHGFSGTAGEIGHVQVLPAGGICRCGARGCLETVASSDHLVEVFQPARVGSATLTDLTQAANSGDYAAQRIIADAGRTIGRSLADLCTVLNPQHLIVGGELGSATDLVATHIRGAIDHFALPATAREITVSRTTLGVRAEALGALILATRSGAPKTSLFEDAESAMEPLKV